MYIRKLKHRWLIIPAIVLLGIIIALPLLHQHERADANCHLCLFQNQAGAVITWLFSVLFISLPSAALHRFNLATTAPVEFYRFIYSNKAPPLPVN